MKTLLRDGDPWEKELLCVSVSFRAALHPFLPPTR